MDQFRGLFSKLDQNEDGFVSVAELQDEMRKHGIISADGKVQVTNILNSIYMHRYYYFFKAAIERAVFVSCRVSSSLMTETKMACWIIKSSSATWWTERGSGKFTFMTLIRIIVVSWKSYRLVSDTFLKMNDTKGSMWGLQSVFKICTSCFFVL